MFMRKLILFLTIATLTTANTFAQVYYCSDIDNTGFSMKDGNYTNASFKLERFNAKIDFDNLQFESKKLFSSITPVCRANYSKSHMTCADEYGKVILIRENLKYQRAVTYGDGDTLHIAYGICENF